MLTMNRNIILPVMIIVIICGVVYAGDESGKLIRVDPSSKDDVAF
jgi:hypothetical protein